VHIPQFDLSMHVRSRPCIVTILYIASALNFMFMASMCGSHKSTNIKRVFASTARNLVYTFAPNALLKYFYNYNAVQYKIEYRCLKHAALAVNALITREHE